MRLAPVSFNLSQAKNSIKVQNQPKLKPMASDSISFSAKIPFDIQKQFDGKKARLDAARTGERAFQAYKRNQYMQVLSLAKNDEERLQMLQAVDKQGRSLLHIANGAMSEYIISQLEEYPEAFDKTLLQQDKDGKNFLHTITIDKLERITPQLVKHPETLKKLLLQKDANDKIPLQTTDDPNVVDGFFNLSPDSETIKAQLIAKTSFGTTIAGMANEFGMRDYHVSHYFNVSSDDEILLEQLNQNITREVKVGYGIYEKQVKPLKYLLSYSASISALQALRSIKNKKELLYDSEFHKNLDIESCVQDSTVKRLSPDLLHVLIEVIQDDSTSAEEALKLIDMYRDFLTEECEEKLSEIEEYLKA